MQDKIQKVKDFYNKDATRYLADRYEGESCEHFSYLARKKIVLDYLKGANGTILDVGCGPAIFTKELSVMGLTPYSVDLSVEMLKKARSLAALGNSAFWANGEIERLPFQGKAFDNVMSIGVIAYAAEPLKAIRELARVVKPGGLFVIQCSNSLAPTPAISRVKDKLLEGFGLREKRLVVHLNRYRYGSLRKLLEDAGFCVEEKRSYDFRLPFLEKFFPSLAVNLMKHLQQQLEHSKFFGWFGEGYVIKARREDG